MAAETAFSLIVAVKDERENMAPLIAEIAASMAGRDPATYEAVFIDDGSSDGTEEELVRLKAVLPALRVLVHGRNLGKSAALRTGIRAARFPIVVTMDGDGQNDPADIHTMLAPFDGAGPELGIVAGQRIKREDTFSSAGRRRSPTRSAAGCSTTARAIRSAAGRRCRARCSSPCPISTTCTAS